LNAVWQHIAILKKKNHFIVNIRIPQKTGAQECWLLNWLVCLIWTHHHAGFTFIRNGTGFKRTAE
jgi:hypothetical protein